MKNQEINGKSKVYIKEMGLEVLRNTEGGSLNFEPIHIYIPKEPEIKPWNPLPFPKLILWS